MAGTKTQSDRFQRIENLGVLPELTLHDAIDAIPVGQAISDGGISMAEVTFRTEAAEDSIRLMTSALPELLIGAGTVLTTEQVDAAVEAGAKFIVSPGISETVVRYCLDRDIPVIPGVATPTDIETALRLGLSLVKFFPAEGNGGIDALASISAPYPGLKFMPSGGINEDNVDRYLQSDKVLAVSGNWMATPRMIEENALELIHETSKRAVRQMLGFSLDHVGVNFPKDEEALAAAEQWAALFDVDVFDGQQGFFAGRYLEAMRPGVAGLHGHIGVGTYHLGRAMAYLKKRGATFDERSMTYDAQGNALSVRLEQEIGGMSILLIQK